jgi:hypothetical protein
MISLRTKRFCTAALLLGLFAPTGLVGCGETSENKTKIEQTGPGGTTTEEKIDKVKQTGANPPAPTGAADAPPPK